MAVLLVAVLLVLLPQLTPATEALSRQRLWVARYDGPAHRNDIVSEVAVSPGATSPRSGAAEPRVLKVEGAAELTFLLGALV